MMRERDLGTEKLLVEEREDVAAEEALRMVRERVADGFFIAESPAGVVLDRVEALDEDLVQAARSLRAFSAGAELLFERARDDEAFGCRAVAAGRGEEHPFDEQAYLVRKSSSVRVRGSGLRLLCRRYFRADGDGFHRPAFERLTGIRGEEEIDG